MIKHVRVYVLKRLSYIQGSGGLPLNNEKHHFSDVADWSEEPTIKLLLCHPNHILQVGFHPPAVIYLGLFKTSLFFDQIWLQLHIFPALQLWHAILCFQLVCPLRVAQEWLRLLRSSLLWLFHVCRCLLTPSFACAHLSFLGAAKDSPLRVSHCLIFALHVAPRWHIETLQCQIMRVSVEN